MKCKKCNRELDFAEEVLLQFVACPFCGAFIEKERAAIEPGSVEAELKKLADDFGGNEIFNEENETRLRIALQEWAPPFDVASDKLLVACIKKIPQRLYEVIDLPAQEQQRIVDSCLNDLVSFELSEKAAVEVLGWMTNLFGMPVHG